jgi:uncharacterized cupredoxin-like copper-binding protein
MHHRMGQGPSPCGVAPPTTAATVHVVLMDMTGHGPGGRLGASGRMAAGMGRWGRGGTNARMMLAVVPPVVSSGRVTFVAVNRGSRTHELVVLPLGAHAPAGRRAVGSHRTVDESDARGEASRSCGSGTGPGIRPGTSGWTTLTLTPGRYELVCNRPGHYTRGMYAVLQVR